MGNNFSQIINQERNNLQNFEKQLWYRLFY